ncbi:MAG: hypothetical protein ICV60_06735 [Pyrinomonadaceae bacterium]|nr:hypothetical protein [Pyrinomonadaceae bacterium]
MRRYVQILGLVMLALAASGWGSVVAAVLCPHANSLAAKTVAARKAKPEKAAKPHCHDSAMEQEATAEAKETRAVPGKTGGSVALALRQDAPCTHCLSKPETPASTVMARQQVEQKRSLEAAALQSSLPVVPAQSFAKPVLYRQGAPPGSNIPKHLLTGVLLI